jgi:hypothetical protein
MPAPVGKASINPYVPVKEIRLMLEFQCIIMLRLETVYP